MNKRRGEACALRERRLLGRDTGADTCVWIGGPAQQFLAAIWRPGPRLAKKFLLVLSAPLRLCVSALRRVALRFWRSLRFNNPAAASEFICVICGYIWEVEMTKLVGGNNGAIQTGGVICVYLRDLRFLLGGFALRLCVRFRPIQFEKPSTGGFVGF